jgi:hypothetical protein
MNINGLRDQFAVDYGTRQPSRDYQAVPEFPAGSRASRMQRQLGCWAQIGDGNWPEAVLDAGVGVGTVR